MTQPSPQRAADQAALRMEAAIQRHTGWQLEYDFTMVVNNRKRLIDELAAARARVAELEGERALIEQAIDTLDCPTWSDVVHAISILQVRAEQPAAAPDRAEGNEQ